jgi:hypothetical protein
VDDCGIAFVKNVLFNTCELRVAMLYTDVAFGVISVQASREKV